jgi:hypothetical protein
MAGDDDRHRVPVVGPAHGAETLRPANGAGNVAVGASFAVGDRQQRPPTAELKICSPQIKREAEAATLAGEIFFQFANVRLHGAGGFLEAAAASIRPLILRALILRAKIARVGTNCLLPWQAHVELQRNQPLAGSSQEQRPYRRCKRNGMKCFHESRGGCGWFEGQAYRPYDSMDVPSQMLLLWIRVDRIAFFDDSVSSAFLAREKAIPENRNLNREKTPPRSRRRRARRADR